jgi:ferritin-like metal-binding protein YciE
MNIQEIISSVNNKIYYLENQKRMAQERGDMDLANSIDNDISNTKVTLSKLETLLDI